MAFFQGELRSKMLRMRTRLTVLLPDEGAARGTLILLHGLKGASGDWVRYTNVERYAQACRLAVFMPEVQRSWYMDMARGLPYFSYISRELPDYVEKTFRAPADPDHLYVAGQSMGGFGAMKCALTDPGRYAGCIALSARFYLENKLALIRGRARDWADWQALEGPDVTIGPENDLEALAEKAAAAPRRPRIYVACGTEDAAHGETLRLHSALRRLGYDAVCEDWPGAHSWDFWDTAIRRGLESMVRG